MASRVAVALRDAQGLAAPKAPGRRNEVANDYALMERISARDPTALGALYDRHGSAVFALCLRVLGKRPEAEEVLGDVFWEVWEKPERYDASRGNPLAYLFLLARSRAMDRLRALMRRERIVEQAGGGAALKTTLHPESEPPSPLGDALTSEARDRVVEALGQLRPAQREAVELSFYDGLSHSEIAQRLGEPLGTIKSRIRQGLIRLRDALEAHYGVEAGP